MIKTIIKTIQGLSASDQILFAVAGVILINPTLAIFAAVLVLACFVYKIGKAVIKEEFSN